MKSHGGGKARSLEQHVPLKLVGYNRERGRKLVPQHLQSANLRPGLSSVWQSPPPSLLLSGIFLPLPRPSSTPPHHIPATPPAHTPFPLPTSPQGLRRKLFFYNLLVPGNRLPRGGASFEFLRPRPLPPPTHSDWRVYGGGAEGSCRDVSRRNLSLGSKRTSQKRLLGEVGGYGGGGGRSRECAVARSGAPPFSREPNKERTAQPTWAWSPASSPTPSPGFQAQGLGLAAGFLAYLQRPPNRPFLQHLKHKNSSFSSVPRFNMVI